MRKDQVMGWSVVREAGSFRPQPWRIIVIIMDFFPLGEMGNHWQMLSREKDLTSVWDMLILEECVRHPGGGVQQALAMNQQRADVWSHHHIDGSGDQGCEWVYLEYCRIW